MKESMNAREQRIYELGKRLSNLGDIIQSLSSSNMVLYDEHEQEGQLIFKVVKLSSNYVSELDELIR